MTNRLHDALLHVHPALERLPGKHFRRRGVLQLLAATGTPATIAALGTARIKRLIMAGSPRIAATLPAQILAALAEQTVTIPATEQYGRVIRGLAAQLLSVLSGGRPRVELDHGFGDRTPGGAMNTRTIAIAALVIAVIVVLILVL